MTHTVEIKGACADRFRAYAQAPMTRKPSVKDHLAKAKAGGKFKAREKIGYEVEEVVAEGDVIGTSLELRGILNVSRVAFYRGPVEEEVCVGSVAVDGGDVVIELVEASDED